MYYHNSNVSLKLVVAGLLLGAASLSHAALINSYDFTGDYSDTLGNGNDLVAAGGSLSAGRYTFLPNQGLRLENALPSTTDYAVEFRFQGTDSFSGYNKLIDFQDLTSDLGLYIQNSALDFYNKSIDSGSLSLNNDYTVGLARSGSNISIFLDGSLLVTADDSAQSAVPSTNVLNFFHDDSAISGEAFSGSVDFIRIHNDPSTFGTEPVGIPAPPTLPLVAACVVLLGTWRFRREKRPGSIAVSTND